MRRRQKGIGRSATRGRDERDARGKGAGGGKLDVGLERVGRRGGSRGTVCLLRPFLWQVIVFKWMGGV